MLKLKKIHINVLIMFSKFNKPDLETTLATHCLISKYGTKKVIKLFGERGCNTHVKEVK